MVYGNYRQEKDITVIVLLQLEQLAYSRGNSGIELSFPKYRRKDKTGKL